MTETFGKAINQEKSPLPPEEVDFKNSRGLTIVGDFHSTPSDSVIIMAHGLGVNRHESDGIFDTTAQVLRDAGFNVLQFDFSGQGESPKEKPETAITPEQNIDDLVSAIKYVKERGLKHIGLLGCSFGAYTSCKAYNPHDVEALLLWAPVSNRASSPEDYYLTNDGRNDLKNAENIEKLGYAIRQNARSYGSVRVGREVFKEWRTLSQKDLLSKIECPTLIIQTSEDPRTPAEDSRTAMDYLPKGSKLEIVEGKKHPFEGKIDGVAKTSAEWFMSHLPR